jgi:hypothetical protein
VLSVLRLIFGSAMILSIILGLNAIHQWNYVSHGAWMMRSHAIGLGAGTQVLTHLPWLLFVGKPGEFARATLMGAAWVINLAFAEWIIRSARTRPVVLARATAVAVSVCR